jgi:hypothetical protein
MLGRVIGYISVTLSIISGISSVILLCMSVVYWIKDFDMCAPDIAWNAYVAGVLCLSFFFIACLAEALDTTRVILISRGEYK